MTSVRAIKSLGLADQVFGVSQRNPESGSRSLAEGIVQTLTIYTLPKNNVSNETWLAFLSAFSVYAKSDDESPSSWATWTLSYLVMAYPEFRTSINAVGGREYTFKPVPQAYFDSFVRYIKTAEEFDEDDQPSIDAELQARSSLTTITGLPQINLISAITPDYAMCQIIPTLYGFAGLLIFLAGKKITIKNSTTITERRPQNLIDAYKIPEASAYILNGEGRLSEQAYTCINQVWVNQDPARKAIVTEIASFSQGVTQSQRVTYTITKLLENAGMSQASFIHKFLQAMPHAITYSCMASSIGAYASSLIEVAAQPSHLQPYYKLIHGERTRVFHRNAILPLAACAIAYETHTARTMTNFTLGEGSTRAVNMFDAEATEKGDRTIQSLAAAVSVQDLEEE